MSPTYCVQIYKTFTMASFRTYNITVGGHLALRVHAGSQSNYFNPLFPNFLILQLSLILQPLHPFYIRGDLKWPVDLPNSISLGCGRNLEQLIIDVLQLQHCLLHH